MIKEFLYEATNSYGEAEAGGVVAVDAADAHLQLGRMGYSAVRILDMGTVPSELPANMVPNHQQARAQSYHTPVWRSVLNVYWRCRYWWLPGLIGIALSLWLGTSLYFSLALLLVGLGVGSKMAIPIILYDQVTRARVNGNWEAGLRYLAWFRRMNPLGGTREMHLDGEQAKLTAGAGRLEQALEEFSVYAHGDQSAYLGHLASIHACAGQYDKAIEIQRLALLASGSAVNKRLDLAWLLVIYTTQYDEVRDLMAGIDDSMLSEIPRCSASVITGLLAQAAGRHDEALLILRQAADDMAHFTNPMLVEMRHQLDAYMAVSLKALGQHGEAEPLWQGALASLQRDHQELIIQRYGRM